MSEMVTSDNEEPVDLIGINIFSKHSWHNTSTLSRGAVLLTAEG